MFVFLVACCTVVVLAKVFTGAAVIGSDYELPTTIYNLTYDTTKPLYHNLNVSKYADIQTWSRAIECTENICVNIQSVNSSGVAIDVVFVQPSATHSGNGHATIWESFLLPCSVCVDGLPIIAQVWRTSTVGDFVVGYGRIDYNNTGYPPTSMTAVTAHEEFTQLSVALWQHTKITPLPNATAQFTTTCIDPSQTVIFSLPLYFNQVDILCEPDARTTANGTIVNPHSFWCHKLNDRKSRPSSIVLPSDVGRTCRASPDVPAPTLSCFTFNYTAGAYKEPSLDTFFLPHNEVTVQLPGYDDEWSPWLGSVGGVVTMRCAATNETGTFFLTTLADDVGPAPDVLLFAPAFIGNNTYVAPAQSTTLPSTVSIGGMMLANY